MLVEGIWTLSAAGLFSGVLAGFLGIGGGVILVPFLLALGYEPVEAAATSSLAILMTAAAGSFQNWRMGQLSFKRVVLLGMPAIFMAQLGAFVADRIAASVLLLSFGCLLLTNLYLVSLRKRLTQQEDIAQSAANPISSRLFTGGSAGFLAGLFGLGGGVIMVPLQVLLLSEPIKVAVRTSLGVIVITAVSACFGHALRGNVLFGDGLTLGIGGLLGVQLSSRYLPSMPEKAVSLAFRWLLIALSIYVFWQAGQMII